MCIVFYIMKIPDNVCNPVLYKRAYETIDQRYGRQTSAYRSMAIVTEYKRIGGKYKEKRVVDPRQREGLQRWLDEEWIIVLPYVTTGKRIPCGSMKSLRREHACRPLYKVDPSRTPLTIQEVLNLHGKNKVMKLARAKKRAPHVKQKKVRVDWKRGSHS